MKAYERLLNYVVVHTASDEFSETTPTTQRQFDLANMLVPEMRHLALKMHVSVIYAVCTAHCRQHWDMRMRLPSV